MRARAHGIAALLALSLGAALPARAATLSAQVSLPHELHAVFDIRYHGASIGSTEWRIKPMGNGRFDFQSHTQPSGLYALIRNERITERSEWEVVDGRPRPLRYSYTRVGGKHDRSASWSFDWQAGKLERERDGKKTTVRLEDGTVDSLSYVLALMRDLVTGASTLRYHVVDGTKLKIYEFAVAGEEPVEANGQRYDSRIVRRVNHEDGRKTTMWFAPALGTFPVRTRHVEKDGYTLDIVLSTLERPPA